MPMNLDAVGAVSDKGRASWTSKDALLYALGVGAGQTDPTGFELEFTTENSTDVPQRVLPTMPVVIAMGGGPGLPSWGEFDFRMLLHGEQGVTVHGHTIVGFRHGWRGAIEGEAVDLDLDAARGLLSRGGTILGSSRTNPFKSDDGVARVLGLKVVAASGWFAARPSGTEDLDKIYAESFAGTAQLRQILQEAQAIVDQALVAGQHP